MGTARDWSVGETARTDVDLRGERQSGTEEYARANAKPELFKIDVGRQVAEITRARRTGLCRFNEGSLGHAPARDKSIAVLDAGAERRGHARR
jgi:hypothetical protein